MVVVSVAWAGAGLSSFFARGHEIRPASSFMDRPRCPRSNGEQPYHNNGSIDPVDGRFSLNGPALATSLDSRNHHGEHSERRRQEKEAPERHAISHHYIRPQPRDVTGVPSTSRIPFIYTQIFQTHKETASRPSPKCFTPCLQP